MIGDTQKIKDKHDYYLYEVNPENFFGCDFERNKLTIKTAVPQEIKQEEAKDDTCLFSCGTKAKKKDMPSKNEDSDQGGCSLL
jgi:hypothetical protein